MATKPTDRILDWASGGSTTDPGGSKEAAGWLTSERIPANWWNWILNSFGQWLGYLETATDEIIDDALPRAAGNITITSGTPSIGGLSFGVDSIEVSPAVSDSVRITWDTAFVSTSYVVTVTAMTTANTNATVHSTETTRATIQLWDADSGSVIDPATGTYKFSIMALGKLAV